MSGDKLGSFALIKDSSSSTLCEYLKKFDFEYGFKHKDVLKLELEGSNYIKNTMSYFWYALENK
jgi:dGTPase